MSALAVVAIGGNSLIRDHDASTDAARAALAEIAGHIAEMVRGGWALAITHGNGPQVGFGLLRSEAGAREAPRQPLDVLGAETQGSIGYLLQQTLGAALAERGISRSVATVVTQVVVDPEDFAFIRPTKPVGPFYDRAEAEARMRDHRWVMVEDAGRGWRRVVPSPEPVEIVEAPVIRRLVSEGVVVIAAGGGGIPVVRRERRYQGVEAVIDKDLASAVLGRGLGARLMVMSTAVEHVALDYGTPRERPVARLTVDDARRHLAEGQFPAGSMGPKITAAIRFLEAGGEAVIITSPAAVGAALLGRTGTRIVARAGDEPKEGTP
jgi:carbamate kinase